MRQLVTKNGRNKMSVQEKLNSLAQRLENRKRIKKSASKEILARDFEMVVKTVKHLRNMGEELHRLANSFKSHEAFGNEFPGITKTLSAANRGMAMTNNALKAIGEELHDAIENQPDRQDPEDMYADDTMSLEEFKEELKDEDKEQDEEGIEALVKHLKKVEKEHPEEFKLRYEDNSPDPWTDTNDTDAEDEELEKLNEELKGTKWYTDGDEDMSMNRFEDLLKDIQMYEQKSMGQGK